MLLTGIICFAAFFYAFLNECWVYIDRRYGEEKTFYISDYQVGLLLFEGLPMLLLGALFPLYMYPTKVARTNGHNQAIVITWINAIFGVTLIFWLAMLIWANQGGNTKKAIGETSLKDKLSELQKLKDENLIAQEEFDAKRKEIIDRM